MYAEGLRQHLGANRVRLDLWNVKPGDSIVDFMSEGLDQAEHFILFWSRYAKASGAVENEWQVALMRSFKKELKIVVVCLDDEPVPTILSHRRYLRHQDGFSQCLNELVNFASGGPAADVAIVAKDVYHEITFCRDDTLLIELFSISDEAEIGPFMVTSDVHHSYFEFSSENGREYQILTSDDAKIDDRNRYGIGFRFTDGGVSSNRSAIMRLKKLKSCGPALSRMQIQRSNNWQAVPLTRVTDETKS